MTQSNDNPGVKALMTAASEERFMALVTATSDVVYSLNADWTIMRELDGRGFLKDAHQPTTDWFNINIPQQERVRVRAAIDEAIKDKKIFELEHRVSRADDTIGWTYSRAIPLLNEQGNIIEWFGTASDITERKRAEELLQETNERLVVSNRELLQMQKNLEFRTAEKQEAIDRLHASERNVRNMVRQAPVGMCIVEGDPMYMTEMNDSFLEIIGRTRQEVKSKPYWEVIPEAKAVYKPITDNVLATGNTYRAYEHEIMLVRNGLPEIVYIDFVYEPMIDFLGKAYAIMIVAIDVTDKVLARRKVERAEESLRMAVDAAELGTYFINATDRIFNPSPRLKDFFGFKPHEEVPYEAAINQIHPDYRQRVADMVEAAFIKGERFDLEYPVMGFHDGRIRWVRGIGTMQHYDGKDFFTGVLHEITERKQDEIRKNDFIGMVSHELKTPLTSLGAIIQVADAKLKDNEDEFLSGAMRKAAVQVKRMAEMINGFLNISRLESGKIRIEKTKFNIVDLVNETVDEMKATVNNHRIDFTACPSTQVFADWEKLLSVLSNLISNAVKYSMGGTTIEILCESGDDEVTVSIKDQGIGIKSSDKDKIFDRYYRVENNNTKHVSGFGIGLYLSAEIIKHHNGRIWLESEPGKGSTFYFSLPLA
ncbi:PAS domain S-box protein [Pedobacter sp. HMF7647]|uniref:histidine kinase n=1 Tax=Hufsiella arboris TaxID=2695275 RepID=A0A7K1Y7T0_9SPHI|nr:ATP-binding protein [Hufsiella arboris]MXV50118.1 PAS domain S-box protein [Hufsiella arboris]